MVRWGRKVQLVQVLLAAALIASGAYGQTGVQGAARVGFASPYGGVRESTPGELSEFVESQIPLQFQLGYVLLPKLYAGGYFGIGFGDVGDSLFDQCQLAGDDFAAPYDCTARSYTFGLQAQYRFGERMLSPWLGAGVGWEILSVTAEDELTQTNTLSGFELTAELGVELAVSRTVALGPYLGVSVAQYLNASFDCEPEVTSLCESRSESIDDAEFHGWFTLGVQLRFGPFELQ